MKDLEQAVLPPNAEGPLVVKTTYERVHVDVPPPVSVAKNDNETSRRGPSDDDNECPQCGGEGFVFQCFDGFCEDADVGCDECTQPCPECSPKVRNTGDALGQVLGDALNAKR